jgi:hypothetical protein
MSPSAQVEQPCPKSTNAAKYQKSAREIFQSAQQFPKAFGNLGGPTEVQVIVGNA